MHPEEAVPAEKGVDSGSRAGAHAEDGGVLVGAHAEVGDAAQKLVGMAFLLERVGLGIRMSEDTQRFRVQFPALPLSGRGDKIAFHTERGARAVTAEFFTDGRIRGDDALQVGEAGAVVDFKKNDILGVTARADPAAYGQIRDGGFRCQGIPDERSQHDHSSS